MTLLNRIFPSDRDIPIARIGPISTMADDAGVWYTTEDDIERMMAQNFILRKPTVVRSRQLGRRAQGLDHFLEALNDHFGDSKVDVQDPSTKKKAAVPLPVCDIIDRIREGADIPAGRLPINLLNLKYLGISPTGSCIPQSASVRCPSGNQLTSRGGVYRTSDRRQTGPRGDGRGQRSRPGPLLDPFAIRPARCFYRIPRR